MGYTHGRAMCMYNAWHIASPPRVSTRRKNEGQTRTDPMILARCFQDSSPSHPSDGVSQETQSMDIAEEGSLRPSAVTSVDPEDIAQSTVRNYREVSYFIPSRRSLLIQKAAKMTKSNVTSRCIIIFSSRSSRSGDRHHEKKLRRN